MFTISVCIIVKNEQEVLSRILSCVKNFADEIIIVDTGSSDRTKEIARKFTDKVFDFEWNDNFSDARNFSFSKATCDYQMWVDADDFIPHKDIEKILALKNAEALPDIFMFKYSIGFNEQDIATLTYFRERLLKRSNNYKWQGFVHEAIVPSGNIQYCDIEIQHRKIKNSDPKRNLKLYQKALKKGIILNSREIYYYARELFYNNYISKAITTFKKFLKLQNTYAPDNLGAYLMLAECYTLKNNTEKAISVLHSALQKHIPNAELCCKIAELHINQNQIKIAIFWYKSALTCDRQTSGFVNENYQTLIPSLQLCHLYYQLGDYETSKQYHLLAKSISPTNPSVLFNNQFFN